MTDVFINYSRADESFAAQIQAALKYRGVSVWRDETSLSPGTDFVFQIREAIERVKCLVTLWTSVSVRSNWVLAEAELAFQSNKLFPIAIDLTSDDLPLPYNSIHTAFIKSADVQREDAVAKLADDVDQFVRRISSRKPDPMRQFVGPSEAAAKPSVPMGKKAFISYASDIEDAAIELVEYLENANCPCWISFRDVDPGDDYRACIVKAMSEVSFLVLLYSQQANKSFDVANELYLARKRNKKRFVLRIDGTDPDGPVEYELGTVQWIDCQENRKRGFERIAQRARLL